MFERTELELSGRGCPKALTSRLLACFPHYTPPFPFKIQSRLLEAARLILIWPVLVSESRILFFSNQTGPLGVTWSDHPVCFLYLESLLPHLTRETPCLAHAYLPHPAWSAPEANCGWPPHPPSCTVSSFRAGTVFGSVTFVFLAPQERLAHDRHQYRLGQMKEGMRDQIIRRLPVQAPQKSPFLDHSLSCSSAYFNNSVQSTSTGLCIGTKAKCSFCSYMFFFLSLF